MSEIIDISTSEDMEHTPLEFRQWFPCEKVIRDCDWMKKSPCEFFMRSILSEKLSKYEKKSNFKGALYQTDSFET